jgi:hypothetical protein
VRALAIDDSLAEAHASMGTIRMWYEWNWKDAEQAPFERSRSVQSAAGAERRFDEAEREIRIALLSDPLSIRINTYLAGFFIIGANMIVHCSIAAGARTRPQRYRATRGAGSRRSMNTQRASAESVCFSDFDGLSQAVKQWKSGTSIAGASAVRRHADAAPRR